MINNVDNERAFCDVFKELRLEKGLSQEKIANELDVSQSLIGNWETYRSTPSPELLEYIADYFDVSVDYLIGRTSDRRYYKSDENRKIVNMLYDKVKDLSPEKQQTIYNVTEAIMKDIDKQLDGEE